MLLDSKLAWAVDFKAIIAAKKMVSAFSTYGDDKAYSPYLFLRNKYFSRKND